MATNFPTAFDDLDSTRGSSTNPLSSPNHITHHTNEDDAIEALQVKVGINSSEDSSSLDYKLTNASSVSPGHKHIVADFSDYAPVSSSTGVSDGNKATKLNFDGVLDGSLFKAPTVQVFTATDYGSSSSQFDITNPAGTTFRYTWDGTGTNPTISSATFPVGYKVVVNSIEMSAGNIGTFTITASDTNYFEVDNASGVAEVNKDTTRLSVFNPTWTKPSGLNHVVVEVQGAGGAGGGSGEDTSGSGGGGGGYARKLVAASLLNSTETVTVGIGGYGVVEADGTSGSASTFTVTSGTNVVGNGGSLGTDRNAAGGAGGTATGGDINITGGSGVSSDVEDGGTSSAGTKTGHGGGSVLGPVTHYSSASIGSGIAGVGYGSGGSGSNSGTGTNTYSGGKGANGIVIVTEYYN